MCIGKLAAIVAIASSVLVVACSGSSPAGGSGANANAAQFNGNWVQACAGGAGDYSITNLTLNNNTATSTLYSYQDAACTTPSTPAEYTLVMSLVFPTGTSTTSQGEAQHVNRTITSVVIDGAAPTAQQQTELQGNGTFNTEYDLYLLSGASLYEGVFTEAANGSSETTRATTLDTASTWMRQ